MDRLSFTVPGEPKGKGRPRFTKQGHAYTPDQTRSYEALVRLKAKIAMGGIEPFAGACALAVVAHHKAPKRVGKERRKGMADGTIKPTKRPDIDNIVKIIADGCNGIVWRDDAQVTEARIIKRYSDDPRVEVSVVHLEAKDRGVAIIKTEAA